MKHIFKVGEEVFAKVKGFQPFPAVVDSVLLTEADCSVFYYVQLQGATKTIPLDANCLLPYSENKKKYRLKYSEKDLKKESKLRVDALLGAEDEIPDVLLNFVTVDSDFEVVSEEAVKSLGLCSFILSPRMVEDIDKELTQNGYFHKTAEDEDFVDVEEVQSDDKLLSKKSNSAISCSSCQRKFKTRMALKAHQRQNNVCRFLYQRRNTTEGQSDSKRANHKLATKAPDPNRKPNDVSTLDKSKWASRSASGYYPCKLCFRKFRSKGEAQLHMSMHRSHFIEKAGPQTQVKSKYRRQTDPTPSEGSFSRESEDSVSLGDDEDTRTIHNASERNRRAELALRFTELATVINLGKGHAKVQILEDAKRKIEALEREAEDIDQIRSNLAEMNEKLKAQYLALGPKGR